MPKLPESRAFLVQLSNQTDTAARTPDGRIEHIDTGIRGRFSSREELWVFIVKVLIREERLEDGDRRTEEEDVR